MPTQNQTATLAATAAAFGLPVTAALPAPKPAKGAKAAPAKAAKASRKPSVRAIVVPASYVPGPAGNPCRKGTWGAYMVAVTLKASTPAAATKAHKAGAARRGFKASKPLDFKWMLLKGIIAPAAQ